jgi:hypothetical protein
MKNKLSITAIALCTMTFMGCKVDDEFSGPDLVDLYGEFGIVQGLDISDRAVDFSLNETTYFTAGFTKNVQWKLQIKGLNSGGIKEITGFSRDVNAANAKWDGRVTRLPMFREEVCAVELTVENQVDTLRDTLEVLGGRINEGFLLSDFESGFPGNWLPFVQSGANMTFNVQTNNNAAQGGKYYDMGGTVNWDWLIGLFDIPATAYGSPTFDLNENPDAVYFNTMVYKQAALSNGIILFQFREDDNLDGTFNSSNEDMYAVEITPDLDGWQLISLKYGDLASLVNGQPANPAGNGVREPHKLMQISMLYLANPSSGYAQSYLDYMIFTENGPLKP